MSRSIFGNLLPTLKLNKIYMLRVDFNISLKSVRLPFYCRLREKKKQNYSKAEQSLVQVKKTEKSCLNT